MRNVLGLAHGNCRVILLRIAPGQPHPATPMAAELTWRSSKAARTETRDGVFSPGDFEEADPTVTHQPRVVSREPRLVRRGAGRRDRLCQAA
ncbi:hypothetical protein ACRAWD_27325 [Caulobacter segnis]